VTVYRHISGERAHCYPVSLMCELLGVSQSGYWAWCKRPPSDRELSDAWLTERIRAIHAASSGRYGSPRVHAVLRRQGIRVGEKRVARLMRQAGLQGAHRRRRKGCTVRVEGVEPFRDLVGRDFRPDAPNRVWAADIKQIKTGEGWLYLAAVQDLFSRRIVGWAMDGHMRAELVVDALEMAVAARRPPRGTIHHSDHGGQGEFNRSSQRSMERSCGGREATGSGSGWEAGDALAGASAGREAGASAAVLGGDRAWTVERGCCGAGRRVGGGRRPVVSGGWRDAVRHAGPGVGAVSVV
jgi:putative transposase